MKGFVSLQRAPIILAMTAALIIPLNYGVWWLAADNRSREPSLSSGLMVVFLCLAFAQFATGVGAVVIAITRRDPATATSRVIAGVVGALAAAGAPLGALFGWAAMKIS